MAKCWLIDSRSIAKKVKNATLCSTKQASDSGAKRECPNCHYWIDNSDVPYEWPGLPAGVKFDPSDVELLDHLAAKCGVMDAKPHMFIDEFIPTLSEDRGICYTHPKNLPGAKKNGSSIHFFHKTANAYASGQRKRRKIQSIAEETVRWHKTGKTKAVVDMTGVQRGCKKIMVLYRCSKKGSKAVKSNWVMHQYHLGTEEDEKEGEYVVSKIYYQQQKGTDEDDVAIVNEEPHILTNPTEPKTPTPNPPRPESFRVCDDVADQQHLKPIGEVSELASTFQPRDDFEYNANLAGESQADLDANHIDDPLLCKEIFDSCTALTDGHIQDIDAVNEGNLCGSYGISDLENLDLDTPPDFSLADLQFCSQDSIFGWLDRL